MKYECATAVAVTFYWIYIKRDAGVHEREVHRVWKSKI